MKRIPVARLSTALCVLVFFGGVGLYSVSSYSRAQKSKPEPARALRLIQLVSDVDGTGTETYRAFRIHDVDVDGNWHTINYGLGAAAKVEYSKTEQGISAVDRDGVSTLLDVKTASPSQQQGGHKLSEMMRTSAFYEQNATGQVFGTDVMAGLKVWLGRSAPDESGGWVEMAHSPKTGMTPLRIIHHRGDGTEMRIETVKVEFR